MDTHLYTILTDPERLKALADTALLDSAAEAAFDRLTRMAARSVSAPVALVSLVDTQRQFFKSCIGLPEPWATRRETPLSHSFCQYTVSTGAPLIVADARRHPLLADNAAIVDLQVIAYAGFPLRTPSGQVIGSLCAIDHLPREWHAADLTTLEDLAELVNNEIARRQTHVELRRTTAHLAALLGQRSEVIWAVDHDLRLTLFNSQYSEYLQRTLAYTPHIGAPIFERVPPERIPDWRERYARAFAGETFSIEDTIIVQTTQYWFETTFCPITEDGTIVEVSVVARDISQAKTVAAERLRLERDLFEAQRMESLGLLAGGVAHDFNNLLTVIMGHVNLARTDVEPTSSAALSLDTINHVARRAADLTHQMLAYAGKGQFVVEAVDLNQLIVDMAPLLRASLPAPIPLTYDLAARLPLIEADPAQIRQIVLNLVLNAAEAIEAPDGRIAVRTSTVAMPTASVVLEVCDTGIGMPPDVRERIFEPFFTTKFTGRGLGLAAVHGVVRQHHGSIAVESTPGVGSCFQVLLPVSTALSPPPHGATAAISPSSVAQQPAVTVLVVDDELSVRSITERLLTRWGYQVVSVGDGEQALAAIRSAPTPLFAALVDWTMPGLHGSDLLEALFATQPDLRVIVMSGYNEEALRNAGTPTQRVGFLHKPFGAEQLQRILAALP